MALDRTPPKTSLKPVAGVKASTAVLLEWNASDNTAGLGGFDIQKQVNNGSWQDLLVGIDGAVRQAWAVVSAGQNTGFRMRGVDRIGNTENYPTSAETSAQVSSSFCSSPDSWENDNTSASASTVSGIVNSQEHNFCNPQTGAGYLNDQDWVRITMKAGRRLIATAQPLYGAAAANLRLYGADGTSLLTQSGASQFGEIAQLIWDAPSDGVVYLQVTHVNEDVAGNDVRYKLVIRNGYHSFLPLLIK
jgi:hypothetical protein